MLRIIRTCLNIYDKSESCKYTYHCIGVRMRMTFSTEQSVGNRSAYGARAGCAAGHSIKIRDSLLRVATLSRACRGEPHGGPAAPLSSHTTLISTQNFMWFYNL